MIKTLFYPERSLWEEIMFRPSKDDRQLSADVSEIIRYVKEGGDSALRELTIKYDKVDPAYISSADSFFVTEKEFAEANENIDCKLMNAIDSAASNIEKFHKAQIVDDIEVETQKGVKCYQRSVPVKRAGLYIPGGSAPLFSTVMMLAIPARIAGCKEIALFTPPAKDGRISPAILYVANLLGIDQVVKVGGAQAIAAMAYGTESIKKVDKIFGPGNKYVAEAKLQVSKSVSIDMVAGPSELMIIANEEANPSFIAADLLSQAEHGPDSQLFLLTADSSLAERVNVEIEKQISVLPRQDIALSAFEKSRTVILRDLEQMTDFANLYGPEHLIISTKNPWAVANKIESAGSVFLGNYSPESAGDYASGTNHSLPTSGWTRSVGGVSVDSFMHKISFQEISVEGLKGLGRTIEVLAESEGLQAHKNAVTIRINEIKKR